MRFLTWIVVLAVAAWSGYWFVGSTGIETGLRTWLEERRNDGWAADAVDVSTFGYPNRFDTTITDIRLADPRSGVAWTMPFFQILALSYKPNHVIAVFPQTQTLSSPQERIDIANDTMRGSVILVPDTALGLDRTSFELDNLSITSSARWKLDIATGRFATRVADDPLTHDIFFEAKGLSPNKTLMRTLDPAGILSDTFDRFEFDATASFDAPWDRFAIEKRRPQFTRLKITSLSAGWGKLVLQAVGTLDVDATGNLNGTLDIRAKNWREMLKVAGAGGVIPRHFIPTIERALGALSGISGNRDTLDAPLAFKRGTMYLAGFPVGQAPVLRLP